SAPAPARPAASAAAGGRAHAGTRLRARAWRPARCCAAGGCPAAAGPERRAGPGPWGWPVPGSGQAGNVSLRSSLVTDRGEGQTQQRRALLLAGNIEALLQGAIVAGGQWLPLPGGVVPVALGVAVEGLVKQHQPAQPQELHHTFTAVDVQTAAPGFQGTTVITLDLIRLQYPAVFFRHCHFRADHQRLELLQAVGAL